MGMKSDQIPRDPSVWRPQAQFSANITSRRQLDTFNDTGGIAVYLDIKRSIYPNISISGNQSETVSFWRTHSTNAFNTKPKFTAGLLTFRFVTKGHIVYVHRDGETVASKMMAVLTGFDSLREVRAPGAVTALSATVAAETLTSAQRALSGDDQIGLPALEAVADMTLPGMWALFCTVRLIQSRITELDNNSDLIFPLFREIMGYQILTSWPKSRKISLDQPSDFASPQLRRAIDYIEAHLSTPLTIADVAAAAGTGVRSLQNRFKSEIGTTPLQFIIDQRLNRTFRDLQLPEKKNLSIVEIARTWGFTHMNDFGQRYRRRYGCTPSDTRREAV